jgi:Zn-dependent protease
MSALLFGIIVRMIPITPVAVILYVRIMFELAVVYNLIFCIFNLIPIPPLDGSHVLFHLLPPRYSHIEYMLTRYGFFLLIGLIFLNNLSGGLVLWGWIGPFVRFFGTLFAGTLTII